MRGSQLYTALFFPSLEFFPTGFSLARFLMRQYPIGKKPGQEIGNRFATEGRNRLRWMLGREPEVNDD
ncbi:hypothetical protein LXL04_022347 [Taraxacum kok-saghyz]